MNRAKAVVTDTVRKTLAAARASPHARNGSELLAELGADTARGLTQFEAERRLARDGPNRPTARPGTPAWRKYLEQLAQPLVLVLIVAAVVSLALGHVADALVIFAIVWVNSVIGFLQEYRAERAIAALDALVVTEATVLRDGQQRRVPSDQLVVGDVVVVASGDGVPADVRLLAIRDLQVDESVLTGESVAVQKDTRALPQDTVLGDRINMAFGGTVVTYGKGRGLVVATGDDTETGRIAGLLAETTELATPLTRKIAGFSKLLIWVILVLSAVLFSIEAVRGANLVDTFNAAVALAVGAIPEGLPAAVTVLLAVGVQSLARRRALVRKLPAVETLGSTTVICSDKTGTLTENEMTVTRFWSAGAEYDVSGVGYDPEGEFRRAGRRVEPAGEPQLLACLRVGALCNDVNVVRAGDTTTVEGDPTEAALRVAAEKARLLEAFAGHPRIAEIPFESQHMYMATLHDAAGERLLLVKGSSDALLDRCTAELDAGGRRAPLDRARVEGKSRSWRRAVSACSASRRGRARGTSRTSATPTSTT
ncbi:MAG TPA: HAD-IC family P-type ATPase [Polyangiaceae bacterium LLY-WYZ-14_1]|nr:HAD-IC family P-type ATPase [Polyangiaceae bacterium LLY-WYZ-14_1]